MILKLTSTIYSMNSVESKIARLAFLKQKAGRAENIKEKYKCLKEMEELKNETRRIKIK